MAESPIMHIMSGRKWLVLAGCEYDTRCNFPTPALKRSMRDEI